MDDKLNLLLRNQLLVMSTIGMMFAYITRDECGETKDQAGEMLASIYKNLQETEDYLDRVNTIANLAQR